MLLGKPIDEHEGKDETEQNLENAGVCWARVVEIVNSPDVAHSKSVEIKVE